MSRNKMIEDIANLTELVDIQTRKWNCLESYLRNLYTEIRTEQLKNTETYLDPYLRVRLSLLDAIIKKINILNKGELKNEDDTGR